MIFLTALQFLTRICVCKNLQITDKLLTRSMFFFPIVGLFIGGIQSLVYLGMIRIVSPAITALFVLLVATGLTGALHIEGFADMVDGFFGGKNKEDILRIMGDSHIGAMGVTAVVCLLLTKLMLLVEIVKSSNSPLVIGVLVFVPSFSRWGMVIAAAVSRYARPGAGMGRPFVEGAKGKAVLFSGIVPLAGAVLCFKLWGLAGVGISLLTAAVMSQWAKIKIGGVTGDVLGGINEVSEVALLLGAAMLIKIHS